MVSTPTTLIELAPPAVEPFPCQGVADNCPVITAIQTDYLGIIFDAFLGQLSPYRGFILLDQDGQLMHCTAKAKEFCNAVLNHTQGEHSSKADVTLPDQVMTLFEWLIQSSADFPDHVLQLHDDICCEDEIHIHLEAQWVELNGQPSKSVLITLEDFTELVHQRASCDAYRYQFTQRETEVWKLHLQGLSYEAIANALYISKNTVKKHMKNAYSKRDSYGFMDDWS